MKTAKEWLIESGRLNDASLESLIESAQLDAIQYAATIINSMSRGTKSEQRSIAIDEARDILLELSINDEPRRI